MSFFDYAGSHSLCVGKSAPFVPEQFGCRQRRNNGREIYRDQSTSRSLAFGVENGGYETATRPSFAFDQHRKIGRRSLVYSVSQVTNSGRVADEAKVDVSFSHGCRFYRTRFCPPNVLTLSCKRPPAVRGSPRRGGRRDCTSIRGRDLRAARPPGGRRR